MSELHYVIVGNGSAGNKAAEVIRAEDKESRITIISAEPHHYLVRHRLAEYLVKEEMELDDLAVRPPEWYDENCIRLRLNQPVNQVNTEEKWLLLAHREKVRYDKMLICSGGRHRIPEYMSHFEPLLSKFSTGKDALLLKQRLDDIESVALIGGDLVGLQLLTCLLPAGKKVYLIMDEYRFWPLEFDKETKDRLTNALAKKGVEIIHDDHVVDIQDNGKKKVETHAGTKVEVDEVIICSGMVPCLEFLTLSGVDMQNGVLVDSELKTSAKDVWAAGECAEIYLEEFKDYRCSTGYVNAVVQGEVAANNMMGKPAQAPVCEPGTVVIAGEKFQTYGWKGFSLDETD